MVFGLGSWAHNPGFAAGVPKTTRICATLKPILLVSWLTAGRNTEENSFLGCAPQNVAAAGAACSQACLDSTAVLTPCSLSALWGTECGFVITWVFFPVVAWSLTVVRRACIRGPECC